MKLGKIFLTAMIAVCASSAAMAQSWTGFYVGLNAGHAWASSDMTTSTSLTPSGYFLASEVDAINAAGKGDVKPSGFTGGLTLGYNWHFGHGFFGFEADWNHFSQGESRTVTFIDPLPAGACGTSSCYYTLRQSVDVGRLVTFRVRGGWASKNWMIYGTAGAANTRITYNEVFTDTFASAYESSWQSHTKGGFVWGGGAEVKFGKHWSLKGEYLSSHFSNMSGPGGTLTAYFPAATLTSYPDVLTHSADLSVDMARVGVNFKF